ncbi:MAG: hypothetical protein ER33_10375 [Cyanobium sp. CACIAM 14]|nr:MAG: hypothetical protein ER33_10375 [Cyanobium sp. CACIAM 14]
MGRQVVFPGGEPSIRPGEEEVGGDQGLQGGHIRRQLCRPKPALEGHDLRNRRAAAYGVHRREG